MRKPRTYTLTYSKCHLQWAFLGFFGKGLHSVLRIVLERSVCTHGSRDGNPEAPLQPTLRVTLSLPFLQHPGKPSDDLP